MAEKQLTYCISGASGLVGNEILLQLLERPQTEKILVLARKPLDFSHPKMQVVTIPFTELDNLSVEEKIDVGFCALGTTLKQAGSKPMQQEIDRDYVIQFAAFCRRAGAERLGVVSAVGANAKSSNFYLRTKGEMEEGVAEIGIPVTVFHRPSFLLGKRKVYRSGDGTMQVMARFMNLFFYGKAKKYRGIRASQVAEELIEAVHTRETGIYRI